MTQTLDEEITIVKQETTPANTNKPPNKKHVVNPPSNLHIWKPGMEAQDVVDYARIHGVEVTALCGAKFIPTRNPSDVQETCDPCLDIMSKILSEES